MRPGNFAEDAQKIIYDTIKMIDEYEAKLEQVSIKDKRREKNYVWAFALGVVLLLIAMTIFFAL